MKKTAVKKINKIVVLHITVAIVMFIVGSLFIYKPFMDKNKALRAQILRERERNVLVGKIRALGKHLKVYGDMLPDQKNVSWLLALVSDMASKENIEISFIKPGELEDRGLYSKLYVVLDTISTYHQLGKFISRIEGSKKFLRIEHIDTNRLDLDENFNEDVTELRSFDVKSHIVISTIALKGTDL